MSQKVLTLYDTLKELEGEFLVKYMQTSDEDKLDNLINGELESDPEPGTPLQLQHATHQFDVDTKPIDEPAGWSMSLTPRGLSIHAVTRNLSEFNEFIKTVSRQVIRDFGADYLPALWDPDAEGYFEQESDTEELEEDEYLVTVPVFCTSSLLSRRHPPSPPSPPQTTTTSINMEDVSIQIQKILPHILQHLLERYTSLDKPNTTVTHHLIQLMLQLEAYLRLSDDSRDELSFICVITVYIISISYFPTSTTLGNVLIPLHDCISYLKAIYLDYILSVEAVPSYQLILCSVLLGWIDNAMIPIAIRLLCNSDWRQQKKDDNDKWHLLIASLIYLDIESATFQYNPPQIYNGKEVMRLSAIKGEHKERAVVILLEAKLMCLLNKVVTLFYQVVKQQEEVKVRKIDVDEVLTLVRDMELWEQELPDWAKWNVIKENKGPEFIVHMHMIYNMVKILLFRPFSITVGQNQEEQTLTKTTFLDLSIQAADKLATCLVDVSYGHMDHWTTSACNLVTDVTERVTKMFDKDEEIVDQLEKIQSRLQIKERISSN